MKRKVIQNYTLCDIIGQGSYGKVYLSIHNLTNEKYAIKVIPLQKFQENSRLQQCSANQVRNLTRIEPTPFIIKFIEMLKTPNNFYFVYEFCNGKTLESKIKEQMKLSQREALRIFRQLLEAFKVLNKYNIMHRDLKPDNIFFHNGNLKLGDFGFCKTLGREGDMTSTMLGSPIYMAPEVLRGEIYTSKADIWSLGVVLYEMLYGVCPFESNSIAKLISTLDTTDLKFSDNINLISSTTKNLLKRLLTKDQFKRIDWFQLLTMNLDEDKQNGSSICGISRESSQKSIAELESRLGNFIPVAGSSGATKIPLAQNFENQRQQPSELGFKRKSDSISKQNPESQKSIKPEYLNSNKSSTNDQALFSQPLLLTSEPPQRGQPNILSAPYLQRSYPPPPANQKRKQLLSQHNNCLSAVRTAMSFIKYQDPNSFLFSYLIFKKIQLRMQKIIDAISIKQLDLLDVSQTITEELKCIKKQVEDLEKELGGVQGLQLKSTQSVLKEKYSGDSNKRLWYEMVTFVTEGKVDHRTTEIQWNSVINSFLL